MSSVQIHVAVRDGQTVRQAWFVYQLLMTNLQVAIYLLLIAEEATKLNLFSCIHHSTTLLLSTTTVSITQSNVGIDLYELKHILFQFVFLLSFSTCILCIILMSVSCLFVVSFFCLEK